MLTLTFLLLALNPLVAHGLPSEGEARCKTVTVTSTVQLDPTTVIVPAETSSFAPVAPPAPTDSPVESDTRVLQTPTVRLTTSSSVFFGNGTGAIPSYPASSLLSSGATGVASLPSPSSKTAAAASSSTTVAERPTVESTSTKAAAPTTVIEKSPSSAVASSSDTQQEEPSTTATATATAAATAASSSLNDLLSDATKVADSPAATSMCGDADRKILPGYPWTVSNAMYNAGQMVGQQCTNYEDLVATADGTQHVRYRSVTDIERVGDTEDLCKGYSNVGIGKNLKKQFRDVKAIPASFQWDRTNTTEFKGANVFDFITAPTSGDGTSTATAEFMLWLEIWGGQVPIGFAEGPVATLDLYGASFALYEGQNPGSGVTVRSALPADGASPFTKGGSGGSGVFTGDMKDWLQAMADRGYIRDDDYVNVGNAGTEVFYGSSEMEAVVALEILV
ncbi:hypothetical protein SLS62_000041 [Diatrype stigma]|uniref:Uncharacterized protein n=1 Tax=Diatrype stigma TaxID=117547 RepID=A0AAN9VAN7_9PEZI